MSPPFLNTTNAKNTGHQRAFREEKPCFRQFKRTRPRSNRMPDPSLKRTMTLSAQPPALSDVERFGNILISAWAPPSHKALAGDWRRSILGSLIASRQAIYFLGHRPGRLPKLPGHSLSTASRVLLGQLVAEPNFGPLYRLPQDAAEVAVDALSSEDMMARWSVLDETTGLSRVESVFLGCPLLLTSVGTVTEVIACTAATPPLQINASCMTNPEVGLRQPDARWLRSIRAWPGHDVAMTWRGNSSSLCIIGGREALRVLQSNLATWVTGPASDARPRTCAGPSTQTTNLA